MWTQKIVNKDLFEIYGDNLCKQRWHFHFLNAQTELTTQKLY